MHSIVYLHKITKIHSAILVCGFHEAEKMVGESVSRPLEVLEEGPDANCPCTRSERVGAKSHVTNECQDVLIPMETN